jgi:hypothetical protein
MPCLGSIVVVECTAPGRVATFVGSRWEAVRGGTRLDLLTRSLEGQTKITSDAPPANCTQCDARFQDR